MVYVEHAEVPSIECLKCLIDAGSKIDEFDSDCYSYLS